VAVDVATVNGVPFVNTAVIGGYPEMVRRRDRLEPRVGKWLAMALAVGQVLRRQRPVRLRLDGRRRDVWTLFVGNGAYAPRGPFPAGRPRLDDGALDVRYLRAHTPLSRTRAVLATLAGVTEHSRTYRTRLVRRLHVHSRTGPVQVARDGEPGEWAGSFDFDKLPGRLVVYRPGPG
jgi:undecaprenyl-diphosphatase